MDGQAGEGAADRLGADRRARKWAVVVLVLLLVLLAAWLVLSLFVLDVVVADAANLAVILAWLSGAAWLVRRHNDGHASMWIAAFLSVMMPFQLLDDLAAEHHWPAGQLHEVLIARRIAALPALACFAMAAIAYFRRKRRTTKARTNGDLTAGQQHHLS